MGHKLDEGTIGWLVKRDKLLVINTGGVMCNMLISSHRTRTSCIAGRFLHLSHKGSPVNITVWCIWKLLRELILKVLITRKKKNLNCMRWWVLSNLIVVIILQYIRMSNHCHVQLSAVCQLYLNKAGRKNFLDVTLWFLMYVTLCWHWPWGNLIKVFSRFC